LITKWKIVDQDFANFELSNPQLKLAAGDAVIIIYAEIAGICSPGRFPEI
jgi:hypothetical protein